MSNGCSIAEILHLLKALQATEANACTMPESRKTGDEVIVPPPATTQDADARKD